MSAEKKEYLKTTEDEIKEFLYPIKAHKKAFITFTVLSVIFTLLYLYTAERVYKTDAKIEIIPVQTTTQSGTGNQEGKLNVETEIDKILSRALVKKTLQSLNENIRYFKVYPLKKEEIYKNSPFKVKIISIKNNHAYDFVFTLEPVDKDHFRLGVERSLIERVRGYKKKSFERVYRYGEKIDVEFAVIKIEKIKELNGKYAFELVDIESYTDSVLSRLSVNRTSKYSNVLEISYEDNVPQRAKDFVDNLILSYIEESAEGRTQEIKQRLKFINSQLEIVGKNLHNSEISLENFKRKNRLINISIEAQETIKKLSSFDKDYAKLLIEKRILDNIYRQLISQEDKNINLYGIKDPVLVSLVQEYNRLVVNRQALLTEYTSIHPDVKLNSAKLDKVKKEIIRSIYNLKKEIDERLKGTRIVINRYEKFLQELPEKEKEFIRIKRRYNINEKIYSYLVQKKLETSLAEISALAGVRIIDKAYIPKAPIKPKTNFVLILGALIGFIFGTAYGYIKDLFEDKIRYIREVESLINAPIVGIVPHFKKKMLKNILTDKNNSKVLKVFRIIRANIQLFFKENRKSQVILITSPEEEDGKATISANLSIAYALSSRSKVIVVDLNFFDPKLHIYFKNVSNEAGILDILKKNSYEDKELEKIIEKNVLEKEILKSVFSILEREIQKKNGSLILEEIEGLLDTIIRRSFKSSESLDEILEQIYTGLKDIITTVSTKDKDMKKLYVKLTNAISTVVRRFSREKVIDTEKEKIFRAQIKYSIKKIPEFENLFIITAGNLEKEDAFFSKKLILTSDILKNIIKELKKNFKYVILNAPSIQSVPEVFMLMEETDLSLLVFRSEKTRKTVVREINKKLSDLGISKVGVIVNDVKRNYIDEGLGA